jgi:hypothetical protein
MHKSIKPKLYTDIYIPIYTQRLISTPSRFSELKFVQNNSRGTKFLDFPWNFQQEKYMHLLGCGKKNSKPNKHVFYWHS